MKKGLILTNAYTKLVASFNQAIRLKEELERLDVAIDVLRNDGFFATVNAQGDVETTLADYDFCVYLDKDKYISQMLEKRGVRLFNRHQAIVDCDDKMVTFIRLADNGIAMPATLSGLLCFTPEEKVRKKTLDKIERTLGYPLIAKECFGSLGKNVYKIDDRSELEAIAETLKCKPHLFQKFIAESAGKDIRVIVVGGKFTAAMLRKSETDFRSNIELGGIGSPIEIPEKLQRTCEKIAAILNLDYCGIDILLEKNDYLVCEVNSNAFFGGIEKVTGVNVARSYAEHIIHEIYKK
ncbi:MAG: RimK family alpha-L-glutamate ligase [Clostridia bacterium]|nr:RimK family alpha-L-glutamate ligase [Clostridia bacterium]